MNARVRIDSDETMELLAGFRVDKSGTVVITFVDSSGDKVVLRLTAAVAHDLQDALADAI